jgi:hypothetical protein
MSVSDFSVHKVMWPQPRHLGRAPIPCRGCRLVNVVLELPGHSNITTNGYKMSIVLGRSNIHLDAHVVNRIEF